MIFARVYVNTDSVLTYYQLFDRFFSLCETKFGLPNKWRHIHGDDGQIQNRWQVVVSDQDMKQIAGMTQD
jgi:hypothetical protein